MKHPEREQDYYSVVMTVRGPRSPIRHTVQGRIDGDKVRHGVERGNAYHAEEVKHELLQIFSMLVCPKEPA